VAAQFGRRLALLRDDFRNPVISGWPGAPGALNVLRRLRLQGEPCAYAVAGQSAMRGRKHPAAIHRDAGLPSPCMLAIMRVRAVMPVAVAQSRVATVMTFPSGCIATTCAPIPSSRGRDSGHLNAEH